MLKRTPKNIEPHVDVLSTAGRLFIHFCWNMPSKSQRRPGKLKPIMRKSRKERNKEEEKNRTPTESRVIVMVGKYDPEVAASIMMGPTRPPLMLAKQSSVAESFFG